MARKRFTEEQIKYFKSKAKKMSKTKAAKETAKKFDIPYDDSVRRVFSAELEDQSKKEKLDNESVRLIEEAKSKVITAGRSRFLITWAQNQTPIHKKLFDNMKEYADNIDAEILVIAGRYKNPTSIFTEAKNESWAREVKPYLTLNRHNIHPLLQILSDVKISPTASTPLSGMNGVTGLESCIVGHPRQHLKSLPVLEGYPHKLLLSTGAVTVPNYTDSKAGKKGEFHHVLGFIIVEIDIDDDFHIRHVVADKDGNFYDINGSVIDGVYTYGIQPIECAILGDMHVRHTNEDALAVTMDYLKHAQPEKVVIHDVFEAESILHWDEKDPFRLLQKEEQGLDNLEEELEEVMLFLNEHKDKNLYVVRSNHDDMLDRWLKNTDWRKARNKKMYLILSNLLASSPVAQNKGVLPALIETRFGSEVKTYGLDDSLRVYGWELGMHGHLGANGSRGGHTQFKNLNTKNIVGHGHHPHKEDGHIMVGTLTDLRVGFNRGASNWMNGFAIIHPNGKAQLINIINGKIAAQ